MEYHHLLSEKFNLFHVLSRHAESLKENVFDIIPITFYVEISDPTKEQSYMQAMSSFHQYYNILENQKN